MDIFFFFFLRFLFECSEFNPPDPYACIANVTHVLTCTLVNILCSKTHQSSHRKSSISSKIVRPEINGRILIFISFRCGCVRARFHRWPELLIFVYLRNTMFSATLFVRFALQKQKGKFFLNMTLAFVIIRLH